MVYETMLDRAMTGCRITSVDMASVAQSWNRRQLVLSVWNKASAGCWKVLVSEDVSISLKFNSLKKYGLNSVGEGEGGMI